MNDRRNAIDTAHYKLNMAQAALEGAKPKKKDLEAALECSKDASKLLKASIDLLDHDCFEVMDAPPLPGAPLFDGAGQPRPEAHVPESFETAQVIPAGTLACAVVDAELVPEPVTHQEAAAFANLPMDQQQERFAALLRRAEDLYCSDEEHTLEGWMELEKAWQRAFDAQVHQYAEDAWEALENLVRKGDTGLALPPTCTECGLVLNDDEKAAAECYCCAKAREDRSEERRVGKEC